MLLQDLHEETFVQASRLSPNPDDVISSTTASRLSSSSSVDLRAESSTRFKNQTRINPIDPFRESTTSTCLPCVTQNLELSR
ncbi:hypothetical protein K0M31_014468 [Melipona bicolor]|uniref:Uncharacterized protein n=1 Tax=Melipona bicolor TaxID=60889 RepID=A0AA40KU71_9HYME|nr:hypothetical protein K0M31_014468 [Melipona bicolor]